eukprot:3828451-Pyramimonas_sp.AAC.1
MLAPNSTFALCMCNICGVSHLEQSTRGRLCGRRGDNDVEQVAMWRNLGGPTQRARPQRGGADGNVANPRETHLRHEAAARRHRRYVMQPCETSADLPCARRGNEAATRRHTRQRGKVSAHPPSARGGNGAATMQHMWHNCDTAADPSKSVERKFRAPA